MYMYAHNACLNLAKTKKKFRLNSAAFCAVYCFCSESNAKRWKLSKKKKHFLSMGMLSYQVVHVHLIFDYKSGHVT